MVYKTYKVLENNSLTVRSSTDGYQPKFLVEGSDKFLKVQCQLSRVLRDDWRVEDIASRVCTQLGIYAVRQEPCNVEIKSISCTVKKRLGAVSVNFEKYGMSFVSYLRLLNSRGMQFEDAKYARLSNIQKIGYLASSMSYASGLPYSVVLKYLYDMVIVDLLVLNQDRHLKNFGVFYNNVKRCFEPAMLFDFGMGLFENDNMFDDMYSLDDCLRYSYIEPFSEDPFVLLQSLIMDSMFRRYLGSLNIGRLSISKSLFPSEVAYMYFNKMKGAMLQWKNFI